MRIRPTAYNDLIVGVDVWLSRNVGYGRQAMMCIWGER
jgi:hypothetical protein